MHGYGNKLPVFSKHCFLFSGAVINEICLKVGKRFHLRPFIFIKSYVILIVLSSYSILYYTRRWRILIYQKLPADLEDKIVWCQ